MLSAKQSGGSSTGSSWGQPGTGFGLIRSNASQRSHGSVTRSPHNLQKGKGLAQNFGLVIYCEPRM
jgi:hypothetical protein